MVDNTQNWSSSWNSSKQPSKQRKYRRNAPLHVKDKLVSANVAPSLRQELGTRSIPLRTGDQVTVMRGDDKGSEGIVSRIDRSNQRVYVNGVDTQRQDGTVSRKALQPSNLQVSALNVEDERRLEKYDVADVESIRVDEEAMEEALEEDEEGEMMKQMQGGGTRDIETEDEEEDETEVEEETEEKDEEETSKEETEEDEETSDTDYDEIVSGTIKDAKNTLEKLDEPDYKKALKAEKNNKNRTTFTDWLENRASDD